MLRAVFQCCLHSRSWGKDRGVIKPLPASLCPAAARAIGCRSLTLPSSRPARSQSRGLEDASGSRAACTVGGTGGLLCPAVLGWLGCPVPCAGEVTQRARVPSSLARPELLCSRRPEQRGRAALGEWLCHPRAARAQTPRGGAWRVPGDRPQRVTSLRFASPGCSVAKL